MSRQASLRIRRIACATLTAGAIACNLGPDGSPATTTAATSTPEPLRPTAPPPPAPGPPSATPPPPEATAAPDAFGASLASSAMAKAHAVTLPRVQGATPAPGDTLPLVTLARTEAYVGTTLVAPLTPGPLGFDGALKRAGKQAALQVLPLEAAFKTAHQAAPTQNTLRVLVDATTSYRAALEVVFSAAQAGFNGFAFLVTGGAGERERAVTVTTPSRAERDALKVADAPVLSFVVDAHGIAISAGDVTVGPGCTRGTTGNAIPLRDGAPDLASLTACAGRLKGLSPAWARSTVAEVTATSEIDMQTVLSIVAVVAHDFPVVHFGLLSS